MGGIKWNQGALRARRGAGDEVAQVVIRFAEFAQSNLRVAERGIEVEQRAGRVGL